MNILKMMSVLSLVVITSACGNMQTGTDDLRTENYNQMTGSGTANPYLSAAQACSELPNILTADTLHTAANQYRSCKSSNNGTVSVKIFTIDESSKNVCLFPVQVTNNHATPFIVNQYASSANRYAVQCVTAKASGATANFGSLPLNGIYVVDQVNAARFADCLAYGDVRTCSSAGGFAYSAGTL